MPEKPLLTIAIPTYNRARYLRELLESVVPQIEAYLDIELLIADNASPDETPQVCQELTASLGERVRIVRHAENIGADANHIYCFHQSRGKYFWLCGDDDVLRPGAFESLMGYLRSGEFDLVYVVAQAFYTDWQKEFRADPYGREGEVVTSAFAMMLRVNTGLAFISSMICNRDRLAALSPEPPEAFRGSQLLQLSWLLPLLDQHRKSLCLWQRWLMGRSMNSSFDVAEIFGKRLPQIAHRLLPRHPELARLLVNYTLRQWFPSMLLDMREQEQRNDKYSLATAKPILRELFARNPRYWVFMYPILTWPVGMAKRWFKVVGVMNHILNTLLQPRETARKITGRMRPDTRVLPSAKPI